MNRKLSVGPQMVCWLSDGPQDIQQTHMHVYIHTTYSLLGVQTDCSVMSDAFASVRQVTYTLIPHHPCAVRGSFTEHLGCSVMASTSLEFARKSTPHISRQGSLQKQDAGFCLKKST